MGWICVWGFPLVGLVRTYELEMYLIGIHSTSILVPALVVVMSSNWGRVNNEVLDSVCCPLWTRVLLFLNSQRGRTGILLFVGFTSVIREVPASLLNVPPDGSTLALSIETLLHFEQPVRIASLCLAYFLTILLCCVGFGLLGYVLDQFKKLQLHKHLKA